MEPRFNLVDRTAAPLPYKTLMHGSEAEHRRKRVLILLDESATRSLTEIRMLEPMWRHCLKYPTESLLYTCAAPGLILIRKNRLIQGMSKSQLKQVKLALYDKRVLPTDPQIHQCRPNIFRPDQLASEAYSINWHFENRFFYQMIKALGRFFANQLASGNGLFGNAI